MDMLTENIPWAVTPALHVALPVIWAKQGLLSHFCKTTSITSWAPSLSAGSVSNLLDHGGLPSGCLLKKMKSFKYTDSCGNADTSCFVVGPCTAPLHPSPLGPRGPQASETMTRLSGSKLVFTLDFQLGV